MTTIQIPDHLAPAFQQWVRDQGYSLRYRGGEYVARPTGSNVVQLNDRAGRNQLDPEPPTPPEAA